MGANRFLKLGGLELDPRGARTFFKAPQLISKPPQFQGAWILTRGLKNIQAPLKLGGLGY